VQPLYPGSPKQYPEFEYKTAKALSNKIKRWMRESSLVGWICNNSRGLAIIGALVAVLVVVSLMDAAGHSTSSQSGKASQATSQAAGSTTLWDWSEMDYNQQMQVILTTLKERGEPDRGADFQKGVYVQLSYITHASDFGAYSSWTVDTAIGSVEGLCGLGPQCPGPSYW
jgi:hypothetical protein